MTDTVISAHPHLVGDCRFPIVGNRIDFRVDPSGRVSNSIVTELFKVLLYVTDTGHGCTMTLDVSARPMLERRTAFHEVIDIVGQVASALGENSHIAFPFTIAAGIDVADLVQNGVVEVDISPNKVVKH